MLRAKEGESQFDDVAAVAKLPDLTAVDVPATIPMRATGTDNSRAGDVVAGVVVDVLSKGREGHRTDEAIDKGQKENPTVSGRASNDLRGNSMSSRNRGEKIRTSDLLVPNQAL